MYYVHLVSNIVIFVFFGDPMLFQDIANLIFQKKITQIID